MAASDDRFFELGPIQHIQPQYPPIWTDPETGVSHAIVSAIDPGAPILGQERVVGILIEPGGQFEAVGRVNAFSEKEAAAMFKSWAQRVLAKHPEVLSAVLYLEWSEWQSGGRVAQGRRYLVRDGRKRRPVDAE